MDAIWQSVARGYVPFVANVGLLALLAWGASLFVRDPFAFAQNQTVLKKIGLGLLFGAVSSALMFMPIELEAGIFGDGRGAPLLLAGIVGGPVTAVLTTGVVAIARYVLGGAGMAGGVVYVIALGATGLAYHMLHQRKGGRRPKVAHLVLLAAVASIATAPVCLMLPPDKQLAALTTIWPKLTLANILGVAILGSLLGREMERLQWESALVRSEQRFRDFAASASDWYWETDAEHRFIYVSDRFQEVTGADPKNVLGKYRGQVALENTQNDKWSDHLEDLGNRRPFKGFSYRHRLPDGRVLTVQANGIPVTDANGEFKGYRGIGADITQRVESEQALLRAKNEAEDASKAKSVFLANMSHELRTPLNAIIGFSEVIKNETMGAGNPRYRDYAADIHESANHLVSLISDLLDLSKIESGAVDELHEEECDIQEIVASVQRLVQPRANKSSVDLAIDIEDDQPTLLVDVRKLKQILVNLLSNAIKFSPDKSCVTLRGRCTAEGGYRIQVIDEGIGIAPEDIPKAMALFGQVDSGMNRKFQGTGLGLPLIKALVEQHGGDFEMESRLQVGTTVTVTLPAGRVSAKRYAGPPRLQAYG